MQIIYIDADIGYGSGKNVYSIITVTHDNGKRFYDIMGFLTGLGASVESAREYVRGIDDSKKWIYDGRWNKTIIMVNLETLCETREYIQKINPDAEEVLNLLQIRALGFLPAEIKITPDEPPKKKGLLGWLGL